MPTKIFFTAGSLEKDAIFGGHPKQIFNPFYFVRVHYFFHKDMENIKVNHDINFLQNALGLCKDVKLVPSGPSKTL